MGGGHCSGGREESRLQYDELETTSDRRGVEMDRIEDGLSLATRKWQMNGRKFRCQDVQDIVCVKIKRYSGPRGISCKTKG